MVTVLKPHGCLSWHLINGVPYSITNCSVEDSLIITPGLNKYREGYSVPFDIHRAKANEEIDRAQRYIIIGYGFGITAFCHVNSDDTRVLTIDGESILSGVNLWDLHEMIKEVF